MKTYTIQLDVCLEADNKEEAADLFLDYLHEIVRMQDLTGFKIEESER